MDNRYLNDNRPGEQKAIAIAERFVPSKVHSHEEQKISKIRDKIIAAAGFIDQQVPENRYKSLALTALEEAALWAAKSLTHKDTI